jgi:hypothetical protein
MEEFHIRYAANDLHTRRHEWVDRPGRVGMIMRRQEVFFQSCRPTRSMIREIAVCFVRLAMAAPSPSTYLPSFLLVNRLANCADHLDHAAVFLHSAAQAAQASAHALHGACLSACLRHSVSQSWHPIRATFAIAGR